MMMMPAHSKHTKEIHSKTKRTNEKQLARVHLRRVKTTQFDISATTDNKEVVHQTHIRCIASNMMKMDIRIRKIPFANPERVSIRP